MGIVRKRAFCAPIEPRMDHLRRGKGTQHSVASFVYKIPTGKEKGLAAVLGKYKNCSLFPSFKSCLRANVFRGSSPAEDRTEETNGTKREAITFDRCLTFWDIEQPRKIAVFIILLFVGACYFFKYKM